MIFVNNNENNKDSSNVESYSGFLIKSVAASKYLSLVYQVNNTNNKSLRLGETIVAKNLKAYPSVQEGITSYITRNLKTYNNKCRIEDLLQSYTALAHLSPSESSKDHVSLYKERESKPVDVSTTSNCRDTIASLFRPNNDIKKFSQSLASANNGLPFIDTKASLSINEIKNNYKYILKLVTKLKDFCTKQLRVTDYPEDSLADYPSFDYKDELYNSPSNPIKKARISFYNLLFAMWVLDNLQTQESITKNNSTTKLNKAVNKYESYMRYQVFQENNYYFSPGFKQSDILPNLFTEATSDYGMLHSIIVNKSVQSDIDIEGLSYFAMSNNSRQYEALLVVQVLYDIYTDNPELAKKYANDCTSIARELYILFTNVLKIPIFSVFKKLYNTTVYNSDGTIVPNSISISDVMALTDKRTRASILHEKLFIKDYYKQGIKTLEEWLPPYKFDESFIERTNSIEEWFERDLEDLELDYNDLPTSTALATNIGASTIMAGDYIRLRSENFIQKFESSSNILKLQHMAYIQGQNNNNITIYKKLANYKINMTKAYLINLLSNKKNIKYNNTISKKFNNDILQTVYEQTTKTPLLGELIKPSNTILSRGDFSGEGKSMNIYNSSMFGFGDNIKWLQDPNVVSKYRDFLRGYAYSPEFKMIKYLSEIIYKKNFERITSQYINLCLEEYSYLDWNIQDMVNSQKLMHIIEMSPKTIKGHSSNNDLAIYKILDIPFIYQLNTLGDNNTTQFSMNTFMTSDGLFVDRTNNSVTFIYPSINYEAYELLCKSLDVNDLHELPTEDIVANANINILNNILININSSTTKLAVKIG